MDGPETSTMNPTITIHHVKLEPEDETSINQVATLSSVMESDITDPGAFVVGLEPIDDDVEDASGVMVAIAGVEATVDGGSRVHQSGISETTDNDTSPNIHRKWKSMQSKIDEQSIVFHNVWSKLGSVLDNYKYELYNAGLELEAQSRSLENVLAYGDTNSTNWKVICLEEQIRIKDASITKKDALYSEQLKHNIEQQNEIKRLKLLTKVTASLKKQCEERDNNDKLTVSLLDTYREDLYSCQSQLETMKTELETSKMALRTSKKTLEVALEKNRAQDIKIHNLESKIKEVQNNKSKVIKSCARDGYLDRDQLETAPDDSPAAKRARLSSPIPIPSPLANISVVSAGTDTGGHMSDAPTVVQLLLQPRLDDPMSDCVSLFHSFRFNQRAKLYLWLL